MKRAKFTFTTLLFISGCVTGSYARITHIQITRVESPTFEGKSFGSAGQYEKLVGRVYGEVDPTDPIDSQITDISLAPKNSSGLGNPMVYGSATGPMVAAAPSRSRLPAHSRPGLRSFVISRLARCHATAPGTSLQHG